MSTIFDLDEAGRSALDEQAKLNPLRAEDLPPSAWAGSAEAMKGLLRPSAGAGRSLMMAGAVVPMFDDALTSAITGRDVIDSQEWYFRKVVDDFGNTAADYWTPDPEVMGSAAKTLNVGGQVVGSIPQMIGTPSLFLGNAALDPSTDLVRQGVDADTAAAVGGVNLLANAAGMKIPASFGSTLVTRGIPSTSAARWAAPPTASSDCARTSSSLRVTRSMGWLFSASTAMASKMRRCDSR